MRIYFSIIYIKLMAATAQQHVFEKMDGAGNPKRKKRVGRKEGKYLQELEPKIMQLIKPQNCKLYNDE